MAKKKPDTSDPLSQSASATAVLDPPAKITGGYTNEFAVEFGGFSSGQDTAKLGFKIDKANMKASLAEKLFVGKRVQVSMIERIDNELPGANNPLPPIEVTADIKGYRSSSGTITAGLTFNLQEIEGGEVMKLANQPGTIKLRVLGVAGAKSDNSTADEEDAADDENL